MVVHEGSMGYCLRWISFCRLYDAARERPIFTAKKAKPNSSAASSNTKSLSWIDQ